MKINPNVIAFISLAISIIAVPASAYLSYYFTKKSFIEQSIDERVFLIHSDLQKFIRTSEQFNSLLSTIITEKLNIKHEDFNKAESQIIFEKNSDIVFNELVQTNILFNIENNIDNLIKNDFINVLKPDNNIYDKLVSLYYQIRSENKTSNEKLRLYKYITWDKNLTYELRTFDIGYIKKEMKNSLEIITQ